MTRALFLVGRDIAGYGTNSAMETSGALSLLCAVAVTTSILAVVVLNCGDSKKKKQQPYTPKPKGFRASELAVGLVAGDCGDSKKTKLPMSNTDLTYYGIGTAPSYAATSVARNGAKKKNGSKPTPKTYGRAKLDAWKSSGYGFGGNGYAVDCGNAVASASQSCGCGGGCGGSSGDGGGGCGCGGGGGGGGGCGGGG